MRGGEGARGPRRRTQHLPTRTSARAPAAEGDWTGFADGLAEDARAAANAITEEDTKTVKVRYDAAVTAAHFEFIEAEIAAAARVGARTRARRRSRDGRRPRAVDRSGRRAEDRGRGGDGRCGKWHVIRRRPSRGGGGGGDEDIESMFGKKSKKKKKRAGAGAAALAAAAAAGGGKMPSLDAVLSQLAKKQTEPTFPDVSAWCVGSAQATGSEAIAAAAATALGSPPGAVVVVPSELFASALTFDLGALGENRAVISAARAAKEDVAAWGGMEDAAVVFVSFDPSEDVAAERDAKVAAAKATAAGRAVVAAAVALAPGGSATRSRDRRGRRRRGREPRRA